VLCTLRYLFKSVSTNTCLPAGRLRGYAATNISVLCTLRYLLKCVSTNTCLPAGRLRGYAALFIETELLL
jgi:hypothetical protein